MKRNIIFDMDGVIFDTERFFLDCCVPAAEAVGLKNMKEAALQCIGLTEKETEQKLISIYGEDAPLEKYREETFRIFRRRYDAEGLPQKAGADEILKWLREEHFRIALASSTKTEVVKRELEDAGLIGYFEVIVGGDMAERSKPAPDIFLNAAKRLGEDPADCFVIEDSYHGVRAAHAAGARVLMVPDLLEPTEEIGELAEAVLPSLADALVYLKTALEEEALTEKIANK